MIRVVRETTAMLIRRIVVAVVSLVCAGLILDMPSAAQTSPLAKADATAQRRANPGNLVGHGGPVKAIAVDPRFPGRMLTGGFDYAAMFWDLSGPVPKLLRRLADHNSPVNATAFVGQHGLTGGDDGRLTVWNLETGIAMHRYSGHEGKIVTLDMTSEGKMAVSASWDRTARLWNLTARTPGPVLAGHSGPVTAAVFSDNAMTVYTASADGQIRAFDVSDGRLLRRVHVASQGVNTLLHLKRGNTSDDLLFGTIGGQSGIVDGATGAIVRMLPDVDRPILALAQSLDEAWSPTKRFAIGSGDGRIRVFAADTGAPEQDFQTPFGPVWALSFKTEKGAEPSALYYGGLDDFATYWPFAPRAPFEPVDASAYPRRFQQTGNADTEIGRGEIQFARKCSICHTLTPDGANRAGPTLHNVFGRKIATLPGYPFSAPLKTLDVTWNADSIAKLFELGPDKFTPGSKMPLQVMSEKADRDALIAFLEVATRDAKPGASPVDGMAPSAPQLTKP